MLTLFRKKPINLYDKVEEIHNETYRLSEKIIIDIHNNQSSLEKEKTLIKEKIDSYQSNISGSKINDIEKLKSIGFTSMPEVIDLGKEKERLLILQKELDILRKKEIIEENKLKSYQRFHELFPINKLLLVKDVNYILAKYGLLIGKIESYTGDIPDKNKKEIIRFNDQSTYRTQVSKYYLSNRIKLYFQKSRKDIEIDYSLNLIRDIHNCQFQHLASANVEIAINELVDNQLLKILNPLYLIIGNKNMFTSGDSYISVEKLFESNKQGFRLNKNFPDPILLLPVVLNDANNNLFIIDGKVHGASGEHVNISLKINYDNIGFIVVSKWGNEKNIGEIQNESMN